MIFNKNLFIFLFNISIITLLTFFSLSLTDLIMIWFIMEINNFIFMSFMSINLNNKKMIFFYFFIQMMSSSLIIFALISSFINLNMMMVFILSISLMLKLNIPPFHFWMIIMINYLNWLLIIPILSIQKVIPFYILSFNIFNPMILLFMIMISMILPPLMSINILNFKKIFLYSSINQSSWLLFLIFLKNLIWLIYFISYNYITILIIKLINSFKLNFFFKMYNSFNFSITNLFMFFNMASLPPFMFMFFKWYNMFLFMNSMNFNLIFFILMLNSLLMTYIYINMINISMFKTFYMYKFIPFKFNFSYYNMIIMIMSFIFLSNLIIIM
nr:NADH dehydrogenase subunit 2 [Hypoponera sauteri]